MNEPIAADEYAWLKPVLATWISRIERYAAKWAKEQPDDGWKDVPYWHNEMATLSTFVAALGAHDADVVSELSCIREDANIPDPKEAGAAASRPRRGRVDLWFELPDERSAYVEAKQVWPSSAAEVTKFVADAFAATSRQVAKFSGKRLGFVFIVPSVAPNGTPLKQLVDAFETLKAKDPTLVATASVFPTVAHDLKGQREKAEENTFPGVILAIRDLTSPSAP
jgi:hypothetical protein